MFSALARMFGPDVGPAHLSRTDGQAPGQVGLGPHDVVSRRFGSSIILPWGSVAQSAPIFIVGTGRCGTTLLRLILNRHRDVAILDESNLYYPLGRYGPLQNVKSLRRLCRDWARSLRDRSPHPEMMQNEELLKALRNARSYAQAVDTIASYFAKLEGKRRWGEKTPVGIQHLPQLLTAFPQAKVIHMTRDPRDYVVSAIMSEKTVSFALQNVYNKARYWANCERLGDAFRKAAPQSIRQVRYEDLVAAPDRVMHEICAFVGLEFDIAMLDTASTATRYAPKGPDGAVAKSHQGLLENINSSAVGRSTALSRQMIGIIDAAAGDWMDRRGYRTGDEGLRMSRSLGMALELGWQYDKFRNGVPASLRHGFWASRAIVEGFSQSAK